MSMALHFEYVNHGYVDQRFTACEKGAFTGKDLERQYPIQLRQRAHP